jgi:hypothetical protein
MTMPNPLDKVTFRGKTLDRKTAAALAIAEQRLGYELTVVQGSYSPGVVEQSAGTHDRGGVVDLSPFDWKRKVRVLRGLGFAAWRRPAIPGLWGEHVHAVMIGHQDLAPAAARQVVSFKAGRDGLKGNAIDPDTYHPDVEPFNFAAAWRDDLLRQRITGMTARIKALREKRSAARTRITYKR